MKRGLIQWNKNEVPIEEFETRIEKTKSLMESQGVEILAIYGDACQSNNLSYLTNFFPYADTGIFVLPMNNTPKIFTTHAYRNMPWFNTITWVQDIVCTDDIGTESAMYLNTFDLTGKKIGIVNPCSFPFPIYSILKEEISSDFIDLTKDFEKIRMVKTNVEKEFTKKAAHIAGLSLDRVKKTFRQGVSGYDLAAEVELVSRKNGAEDVLCLIQPDNSLSGLSLPTSDPIATMCSVEINVEFQGQWAKLGQTLISTDAPKEVAVKLEELTQCYQSAVVKLRVGISFSSWANGLKNQLEGHDKLESIEIYSDPGLEPYWAIHRNTDGVFQNGMAFYTRTILRLKDKLHLTFSDTFTIGSDGVTSLRAF